MSLRATIAKYIKRHGHLSQEEIAEHFGCSPRTYRYAVKLAQKDGPIAPHDNNVELKETESGPNRDIVSNSSSIRTLNQLIEYCRVDLTKWEVSKHTVNSWGSVENKSFQVKAWLKLRGDELSIDELKDEFSKAIRKYKPCKYKPIRHDSTSCNAAVISIHDLHYGSLCWGPETGEHYDIKIAEQVYLDAVRTLSEQIKIYNPEKIIFPVGSDFFNVNSELNITAAGTPQAEDARWMKTFVYGRIMAVRAIDILRNIAPVYPIIIRGNHDNERSYFLGDSLYCWYRECDNVVVDNSPQIRKYLLWGECLVGFGHGKEEKKGSLPMVMATEAKHLWSKSKYREFEVGHYHHFNLSQAEYGTEDSGVRVRYMPALTSVDDWHKGKGFFGLRSAEAAIWHKNNGNIARFSYQPN